MRHIFNTIGLPFLQAVAVTKLCLGASMMPTIHNHPTGTVCLVDMGLFSSFKKGDVVLAVSPVDPGKVVCKRVIATAGDTVNAPPRADAGLGCHTERLVSVPAGHVWLAGDNLQCSTDSREYGPVPYQLILGRPFIKLWPPSEMGEWIESKIPRHVRMAYRMTNL